MWAPAAPPGWAGVDSSGLSAPRCRGHEEASEQGCKDFLLQINSKDVQMDTSNLFENSFSAFFLKLETWKVFFFFLDWG